MTTRPVFFPITKADVGVQVVDFPFQWHPGFSLKQKQLNILALHDAVRQKYPRGRVLEISSKSTESLGMVLSAFNLGVRLPKGERLTVESIFQASKVFLTGDGPFPEWYARSPRDVRTLMADYQGIQLDHFEYKGERWALTPSRAFYDWIYCNMLHKNPDLVEQLKGYIGFTDIVFNPTRSLNCQAYAVALYISLLKKGVLEEALQNQESFLKYHPKDVVSLKRSNQEKKTGGMKRTGRRAAR